MTSDKSKMMPRRLFGSLRYRVSFSIVAIVLAVSCASIIVDYAREYYVHIEATISSLMEQAYALKLARANLPDEQDFIRYADNFCEQINENISPGHHILVLNPQGDILASSEYHSGAEVERALLAAGPSKTVMSVGGRDLAQARLTDDDGATIIVAQYLDHMQKVLRNQLISRAVSVGAAAAAIIVLVFLTMSKWVIEPLSRLQAAIKAWSERRFSVRSEVTGPDDIRLLASEFNVMAERIERYEAERGRAEEERLRLEVRLQHTQKLESLGVLAGGIAHDFNNLLTGVLGYADLALTELPGESPARSCVEAVKDSAILASDLSKQMLAYSGKGSFIVEPLDLNEIIRKTVPLIVASVDKTSKLELDLAENLPPIEADATQLTQVIMNLTINASEAIGKHDGRFTIRTGSLTADRQFLADTYLGEDLPEGCYVYLDVSDTGCGMTEEVISKAFEPFFTTKFTGRGLGLAVVLGIVRGHKAAIQISSKPGNGTMFRILFPASSVPLKAASVKEDDEVTAWKGRGTVLVVDDETIVRDVAKALLEASGFGVLTAVNGRDAIEVFASHSAEIAVVLLDLTMPDLGGEQVFREMHAMQPEVPVLLCSGYSEEDIMGRFPSKGLAGFIQKPFESSTLIRKLRSILGMPANAHSIPSMST